MKLTEWVENKEFDNLWTKYVPSQGEAKTLYGEAIRAVGRLEYEYYNNGFGNAYRQPHVDDNEGEIELSDYNEADSYYGDLGSHLVRYINNKADGEIKKAAQFITPGSGSSHAKPWFGKQKEDKRFSDSIKVLKAWFVENEPKEDKEDQEVQTESTVVNTNKLFKGKKDIMVTEDKQMRIAPKSGVDRSTITSWLLKQKYEIVSENEKGTGHIVLNVMSESSDASTIYSALKRFANFEVAKIWPNMASQQPKFKILK